MKPSNDPSNISLPSLQEEDLLEIPITPSKLTTSKLLSPSFRNSKMTSSPHSSPSQSNAAHRGLGIKITKRPSDTVLSTISHRTSSVSSSLSTMTSSSQQQHHQQQQQMQPLSPDKLSSQMFESDVDLPSPQGPSNSNSNNTSSSDRRPLSSESSDGSEATVESNSRLSSMSSVSSTDFTRFQSALKSKQMALPPMVATTPQQQQVPHQISQIASHNFQSMPTLVNQRSISQSTISSSSSTLNQQDYNRRALVRRNTAKSLSKSEKKKLYDELEEDGGDDITEYSCVFNVPLAMHSTTSLINNSSSNSKSSEILSRAWNNNDRKSAIPPSPLPGNLASYHNEKHQYQQQLQRQQLSLYVPQSKPTSKLPPPPVTNNSKQPSKSTGGADYLPSPTLSKHSSYKNLSPMAQQLTKFYEYSIHNHLDDEFNKRSKLINKIPSHYNMMKDNEQKLEDLRLISSEKIDSLTITRPTWLPPKNKHESLKHEKEFQKMVELQGKLLKRENGKKEQRERDRMIGDARLTYLSTKAKLTSSNVAEIKKLIWRSNLEPHIRFAVFLKVLSSYSPYSKTKFEELKEDLLPILSSSNYNPDLDSFISSQPDLFKSPKMITMLTNLMKCTMLKTEWQFNNSLICLSLLKNNFNVRLSLNTLHYLNTSVVTETFISKFNKNASLNPILESYLAINFKDDYNLITFNNFLKLLNQFDSSILFKLINLLFVYQDYKVLYAFILTILLHYHFGWNSLQLMLINQSNNKCGEKFIQIDDDEVFWGRVYGYYKKF